MKNEFSWQIFEKYSSIKFHENPCSGSWAVNADGQTNVMKLIVTFRSFTNAPNKSMEPVQLCHLFDDNWVITVTK